MGPHFCLERDRQGDYGYGGVRTLDDVDGEGRANLYENSQPRGFDFKYVCDERLMNSMGYETFPARWKKSMSSWKSSCRSPARPASFKSP